MQASNHLLFYVGTYTDSPSESRGIGQVSLNQNSGELIRLEDVYPLRNPSYLTQTAHTLYSFSEVAQEDGAQLVCLKDKAAYSVPIEGDYPCHVDVSADGQYLAVANYGSGNVSIYSLDSQGIANTLAANLFEDGQGPNKERQLSPHAHQAVFLKHQPTLATVDLGSDAVRFYTIEQDKFSLAQTVAFPPGSGPRHLVFNHVEETAYVVCELSETLVVLTQKESGWQIVQQLPLLLDSEVGQAASAIKLSADERFVYASCRHQNQISCFDVSGEKAKWLFSSECGGAFPRDFTLSSCGEWLVVANQHSNNLVSYQRNPNDGTLTPTGHKCQIDSPVCLVEQPK
ncbi:6-phosphogluconolactonase [Vibrio sinaloensis]|uniref:lactonase family protein n=1 Tax=Photobacterium sp. (strain ATCC 43367) TaxID=379097 RepID=UPI00057F6F82|nr:lactonase family protein [Vibrio sinaloensis]KIE22155.1 6-phosphogluconolactonase [Vibrio sinaloensis]